MKKILVPTDFSPIADNALKYAIEIAAAFKSELFLYHVYHIHKVDYDLDFPKDRQPFTKQVERRMNRTRLKFLDKITEKGLMLQTKVEQDNIFSLFKRKTLKHGIDLIVMGSKGASGLSRVVFGSVAATALETAEVPVLVIPPKTIFRKPENIVLAVDCKKIDPVALSPLQKLAFKFGAKVTLLNVSTGSNMSTSRKIDLSINGVETTYHEVPMSTSINESINEFCKKNGCDLLCMIRREKGFFESIFQKSITKEQVYNSQVPLLIIPEN